MRPALRDALGRALHAKVIGTKRVSGGNLNSAFRLELDDGRVVFAKTSETGHPDAFEREAEGLRWLAEAQALQIPEVVALGRATHEHTPFLVLAYVEHGHPGRAWAEDFGTRLARLHAFGAPTFGWHATSYLGPLPQDNTPSNHWLAFYRERRIEPLLRRCLDAHLVDSSLAKRIAAAIRAADQYGPFDERPARLHGDLWSGNVLTDKHGAAWLIDPAPYGGHREVDLAMMRLFGGFAERTFDAYNATFPLAPGANERVAFYQLYPLLVHVALFGSGYVPSVNGALAQLGH